MLFLPPVEPPPFSAAAGEHGTGSTDFLNPLRLTLPAPGLIILRNVAQPGRLSRRATRPDATLGTSMVSPSAASCLSAQAYFIFGSLAYWLVCAKRTAMSLVTWSPAIQIHSGMTDRTIGKHRDVGMPPPISTSKHPDPFHRR